MSNSWFEEKPSDSNKSRIERAAAREIDSRFESSRRGFWSELVRGFSDVGWKAGLAGGLAVAAGVWFIVRENGAVRDQGKIVQGGGGESEDLFAGVHGLEFDLAPTSLEELNLVADLELFEDYEYLESISDSELERGDVES